MQSLLQRVALWNSGCEERRYGELGVGAAAGGVGGARHSNTVGKAPGDEAWEGCWEGGGGGGDSLSLPRRPGVLTPGSGAQSAIITGSLGALRGKPRVQGGLPVSLRSLRSEENRTDLYSRWWWWRW